MGAGLSDLSVGSKDLGESATTIIYPIAILNDLLIVREQDARTVRILPWIDFATDLGLLYAWELSPLI